MLELYKRIRKRREELNMTQDALAKRVGYKSRTSIHKIELGATDLPQSKIMEIANALATTPEYLMGWVETPARPITADEVQIVDGYRTLSGDGQRAFLEYLNYLKFRHAPEAAPVHITQNNRNGDNNVTNVLNM